jgi:hypothetical protein
MVSNGAARPTMMVAGVAGSSASGRVMRTTVLANSSESPTSRPTMRCQTTSVRLPPTIATRRAHTLRDRRAAARAPWSSASTNERRVTEPRRADADSDQHRRPSVLSRRAQTPPVQKLVEAYKTVATLRRKGVVVLPAPQRGRPARDCDVAIPATRTVATWRWRRLRRAVTRVRPCAEPRFSSVTLGVSTVGPSP